MRRSIRPYSLLLTLVLGLLAAALVAAWGPPARAATTYLPPALFAGGNAALSGTSKVTSPVVGGQPTAAVYVKGKLTNTSSGGLSTVKQVTGTAVPALSLFMPDSRITALTTASQVARQEGTVYPGLSYSGTQSATFAVPITVNGNLSISGSGTYSFASVYVTGNVSISNSSAKFSFGSLRVGGSLSVSGGTAVQWGPTYVAGSVSLSGREQLNMSLLVTGGSLAISGTQTIGGDGVGGHARPVTILLTGQSKGMSHSSSGIYHGLLCNTHGAFSQSGTGSIKGSVLCGGAASLANSASIAHDPNVGNLTLDAVAPTTIATQAPLASAAGWNNSAVLVTLNPTDTGGSGVATTYYKIDDGAQAIYTMPFSVFGNGTHTVSYWSVDVAGNPESARTLTVKIDTTAPQTSASASPATWTNGSVTVTLTASDIGGSGPDKTWYKIGSASAVAYSAPFSVSDATAVSYWSTDKAGNIETSHALTPQIDKASPTLSISSPADGGVMTTSTPELAFTMSDQGGSGIAPGSARMVLDNGVPSVPFANLPLLADGTHTVIVSISDLAGNTASASSTFTVRTDTTPPTTTATRDPEPNASGWNAGPVTFSLSAQDNAGGAGVAHTYYAIDGAQAEYWSSQSSFQITGDGIHQVSYWSVDAAGNVEKSTDLTVGIDSGTPTVSAEGSPHDWTNHEVTLVLTPSAAVSGVTCVEYKLDSGDWQRIIGPFLDHYTVLIGAEGWHTVAYRATNGAGTNSAESSCSFGIDRTEPTVALTSRNGSETGFNMPVFDFSASDIGGSELASDPKVMLDDAIVTLASGEALPDPLGDGDHVLTVIARDVAGNETSASYPFAIAAPLFSVNPGDPHEGDIVGLYADDTSATGNADGSWDGKVWHWTVTESDLEPVAFEAPVGFAILDTKADYQVRLSVTDQATGARCVTSRTVSALPQAPRVHALNVEALDGQPAKLVGRFLDPGWIQTHTATWEIDGIDGQIPDTVTEDNLAAMDSGFVSGITPPLHVDQSPLQGHLTVTDSTGASTSVPFTITVRADEPTADETNDTCASATVLRAGQVHLSYIQSANDVDIFEVRTPEGAPLPYGTEVLATLRDTSADCDLAVIQDLGPDADVQNAPLEGSSLASAAVQSSWLDAGHSRGIPYDDFGHSRGIPVDDLGHSRGIPLDEFGHSRGIPVEDLGHSRGIPFVGIGHSRGIPYDESAYLNAGHSRGIPIDDAGHSRGIPLVDAGHSRGIPYDDLGHSRGIPFVREPLFSMLFSHTAPTTGNSLDGYSFSDMSFTRLGNDTVSGNDIGFPELGFDNEDTVGKLIAGFSAASGTTTEVVQVTTDFVNGKTYIAVKGANGAFSDEPYTLQVETSLPVDTRQAFVDGTTRDQKVEGGSTDVTVPYTSVTGDPQTLYVTQPERIDAIYKTDAEPHPWADTVWPKLTAACESPDAGYGAILALPSHIYDEWDKRPWDTTLANSVSQEVRQIIDRFLYGDGQTPGHPSIKYVVLVGSDEVVPQHRVQDETILGNERAYVQASYLKADSPLLASMFDSKVLTDDYYVDAHPVPYNGRSLYIPDMAVARLVETPAEIAGAIQRFLDHPVLAEGSAVVPGEPSSVVTGQDFMKDGALRVKSILDAAFPDNPVKLEDLSAWKAADVRRDMLDASVDATSLNAHFVHYGGISAYGYNQELQGLDWAGEFLASSEIAGAPDFVGKLVFSMGCHVGLNVPDDQVGVQMDSGGGVDPRLDIAQAMARQQGVLVGSTGFGFGDTETIAGTEALVGIFADQASTTDEATTAEDPATAGSGQPIGLALAAAKRQYLGSLTALTPYDEKSSIEFEMYGMPQYRLKCATHEPATGLQGIGVGSASSAGFDPAAQHSASSPMSTQPAAPPDTFTLHVVDPDGTETHDYETSLTPVPSEDGTYFAADGDTQATADRPIQPRAVIDLGSGGENPVRSVIVTAGTCTDLTGFDPGISQWTNEWLVNVQEPRVATNGWWPAVPATLTTITGVTPDATQQRLVVLPGQFLSTSAAGDPIRGVERLWEDLTVELIRGPVPTATNDNAPPSVGSVTLSNNGDTWTAKVDAADTGLIRRIDVTRVGKIDGTLRGAENVAHITFDPPTPGGSFDVPLTLSSVQPEDVSVMVAVTDVAGNTTTATDKGLLVTSAPTGTMTLNGGSATTYDSLVIVDSQVVNAVEMRTSVNHTTWTNWRPYESRILAAMPGLPGVRTVWVQYRNADPSVLELSASVTRVAVPLAGGGDHSLITKSDASLWASGSNSFGQLGDGTTNDRHSPVQVGGDLDWPAVAAGSFHSVGLRSDGSLWTWGWNGFGQLGDGSAVDRHSPVKIGSDHDWAAVASGHYHNLGLKGDGSLWTWGSNFLGELGDGSTTSSRSPVRVGTDSDWAAAAAGMYFSLALKTDGSLWAWGDNGWGQLGDGTTTPRHSPVQVGNDHDWVAISSGEQYGLALKSDGSLWAWGDNQSGQLGDGSTDARDRPVQIGDDHDWMAVDAGGQHSLALKSDGSLWAWGDNAFGQLGDGVGAEQRSPEQIGGDHDWVAITGGQFHSLALKDDGSVWAWGRNASGQLGDGTTSDSYVPERVLMAPVSHTISVTSGAHGGVSPSGSLTVVEGTDVTFAITVDAGYVVSDVSVDGVSQGPITTYTFAGVTQDHTIAASFIQALTVSTLAGLAGNPGVTDGSGSAARFDGPAAIACDSSGILYVADTHNSTIRKVTPAGDVTTFAGAAGQTGSTDGTGNEARFNHPQGLACDAAGNVYVADTFNFTIRKITPAGVVTTLAGTAGRAGSDDGTGSDARFQYPVGAACDDSGTVYVADVYNYTIRKITSDGQVTTLAGSAGTSGSSDGIGSAAQFANPSGVACDDAGNVYVADTLNSTIRKITSDGQVTTLAGSAGSQGDNDGMGSAARFSWPSGVTCDVAGNVFVADWGASVILRVTADGEVTTLAGSRRNSGSADGTGSAARFSQPLGLVCDAVGNIYVADTYNNTIRKAVFP